MTQGTVIGDIEITPDGGDSIMMFTGRKFKINEKMYVCVEEREVLIRARKNQFNNSDHTYVLREIKS